LQWPAESCNAQIIPIICALAVEHMQHTELGKIVVMLWQSHTRFLSQATTRQQQVTKENEPRQTNRLKINRSFSGRLNLQYVASN
jgi:hypothetical protein